MVATKAALPRRAWLAIGIQALGISALISLIYLSAAIGIFSVSGGASARSSIVVAALVLAVTAMPLIALFQIRHFRLKEHNRTLRELAFKDSMLGCMNRRGFIASANHTLQHASATRPCALLIADADNFKRVNDRFGHIEGDRALQIIAKNIRAAIRSTDKFGRIGGEEFAILLPGVNSDYARRIAGRIREEIAKADFAPEGERHQLSVSIGGKVAYDPTDFATLYQSADTHLYAAKIQGRNKVSFTGLDETDQAQKGREAAA